MSPEEREQKIARIESTMLGFEDHGLLTATVRFTYGGSAQSIGTRAFGSMSEDEPEKWRRAHEMGMDFVRRVLLACGVDEWERLKGRTVLVTCSWSAVHRIDPLPTERGEGFDIDEWAASYSEALA